MRAANGILAAVIGLLALLNGGIWLLRDRPLAAEQMALAVPYALQAEDTSWVGLDDELLHNERLVLAPAELTSRIYRPVEPDGPSGDAWRWVWLDVLQSDSVNGLHNFYDSMVASGGRPQVLGERVIRTARGPLRVLMVRNQGSSGKTFIMMLWYQWRDGTAPSRWQWYGEVLRLRALGRQTTWMLVKLATPVRQPDRPLLASPEAERLERFARAMYEKAGYRKKMD